MAKSKQVEKPVPHALCVVCQERIALRHFVCPECISIPEMNHNAVGSYLRGVKAFLEGDDQCPYEGEMGERSSIGPNPIGSYRLMYASLWRRGYGAARDVDLVRRVREVHGEDWRLRWHDRLVAKPNYLGHGKFRRDRG